MILRIVYLVAMMLACVSADYALAADQDSEANFYGRREEGWFWYKDPPAPKQEEAPPKPVAAAPAATPVDPLEKKFEDYKREITQARIKLFFEPTPQNAERFAALQTELVRRSSDVADVWQRVVWANPNFDFTQDRPVTRLGLDAWEAKATTLRRETFDRLAATSVIYFFFRSDCPYCHEFAPTLARFSKATGIKVFPVTLDGGNLPDFPNPTPDNGMAGNLNVTSWPAVFLGEPAARQITPIGFGVMSEMELGERLVQIANPQSVTVDAATPRQAFNFKE